MISSVTAWEEIFFKKFVSISNRNYQANPLYILEQISTFKEMLDEHAPFNITNRWQAWVIEEDGVVVGRIFASTRTDQFKQKDFLPFGYFEADSQKVADELFNVVEQFAKEQEYHLIKGPIQGNVFNSSRFITKHTKSLFMGEPLHKKVYLEYFKRSNFIVGQTWITGYFDLKARVLGMYGYLKKFKKSPSYKKKNYTIRQIDMAKWDEELELIYSLMLDSYSEMDDVELITFAEFKVWNDGLRHIVYPRDCLILDYEGESLGFLMALKDRRRDIANLSRSKSLFNKLKFLKNQRMHSGLLLINYLGKKKNAEGKVRGVSYKIFKKLANNHLGFLFTPAVFGYMSDSSRALNMTPEVYQVSSEYCMFQKILTN